jgi:hypothetical protein
LYRQFLSRPNEKGLAYFASGNEREIMAVFRKVQDDIKGFTETMPVSLEKPA